MADAKTVAAELAEATPEPSGKGAEAECGGALAAAFAMIDRLPLTPAEKAEAVRRLLAERAAGI